MSYKVCFKNVWVFYQSSVVRRSNVSNWFFWIMRVKKLFFWGPYREAWKKTVTGEGWKSNFPKSLKLQKIYIIITHNIIFLTHKSSFIWFVCYKYFDKMMFKISCICVLKRYVCYKMCVACYNRYPNINGCTNKWIKIPPLN